MEPALKRESLRRSRLSLPIAKYRDAIVAAVLGGAGGASGRAASDASARLVLLLLFLVAPIAAHFAWNALEDLGLGLMPNPGTGPFGALRDFDLLGTQLWGGSEAGLAGGVGMTIVLVALLIPAATRSSAPI